MPLPTTRQHRCRGRASLARCTSGAARATSSMARPTDLKMAMPPVRGASDGSAGDDVGQVDGAPPVEDAFFERVDEIAGLVPASRDAVADDDVGAAHGRGIDFGARQGVRADGADHRSFGQPRAVEDGRGTGGGRDHDRQILGGFLRAIDGHDFDVQSAPASSRRTPCAALRSGCRRRLARAARPRRPRPAASRPCRPTPNRPSSCASAGAISRKATPVVAPVRSRPS